MESARAADRIGSGFVFGLVLIAAGISSLLERAHVFETISVGRWWPLLLVAVGLAKLTGQPEERRRGWLFLAIGGWCLIVALTPMTLGETWPLILMIWGGSIIWNGLTSGEPVTPGGGERSHVS